MMEDWKDIKGYEGLYQVSSQGRIKSLRNDRSRKEKILKPWISGEYHAIEIFKEGVPKRLYIHRVVAEHFVQNPYDLKIVNHINRNKLDNSALNLEWCNESDNTVHGFHLSFEVAHRASLKLWVVKTKAKLRKLNISIDDFIIELQKEKALD